LKSPTEFEFFETPLDEVVNFLREHHHIEVQIDKKALEDLGIGTDTQVTKSLKGISLRSALKLMLRELDLTYMIKDEVLLITTPEVADNQLSTKVYPVADLVLPIPNISPQGGMGGMMGGMGMGMGGMGMGGMGMGMGGMGMGMGGMGMGGMGGMGMGGMGGFMNVPRGILPRVPPGGFQAFSVKDDVKTPVKGAGAPAKAATAPAKPAARPAAAKARPKGDTAAPIQIEIPAGANPAEAWEQFFAAREPDNLPEPAAVRDAVRRLMGAKNYTHVVALIEAALRHGDAQPWMYEAMVIAMVAEERPKAEIERAVMSAVEFAQNPMDLMYIGIYLTQLGFDERALSIFQQVSAVVPARHEPFVYGLQAAKRAKNFEGIKWAAVGILSQAWPREQANIWNSGLAAANDVLEKLRAEKRTAEAKQFRKALDEAVTRDIVAIASYTGDAEVDILMEEPSGTVCSLRNPRTTGGGILLGDSVKSFGGTSADGRSQVYVCGKGFDGTYRLVVRRVWGKVTTGKVTVDVYTHYRGENGVRVSKKIPLDKGEAMVVFDLKGGRRTEPLAEQQLANAVAGQMAVNRQVLAQQLAAAVDPQAMQQLAASRAFGGSSVGNVSWSPFVIGQVPVAVGGAVGYQPVIISLPEGANMWATAVVSADRRYVRITCMPMFSGIAEVHTYNTSTGATNTTQTGTGGQGFGDLFANQPGGGGVQQNPVGGGGNVQPLF